MQRALWIGGPPGVGKSTVADRLARRHGLRLYSADTRTWIHRDRALAAGVEAAERWEALPPAERGNGSPDELLAMSLHVERGPMVVEDVRALPPEPLVVAEGTTMPASLVPVDRALWLLPTPELQHQRLEERGWPPSVQALYELVSATIEAEAAEARVPVLSVDGSLGIEETVDKVEHHFAWFLAAESGATTVEGTTRALARGEPRRRRPGARLLRAAVGVRLCREGRAKLRVRVWRPGLHRADRDDCRRRGGRPRPRAGPRALGLSR